MGRSIISPLSCLSFLCLVSFMISFFYLFKNLVFGNEWFLEEGAMLRSIISFISVYGRGQSFFLSIFSFSNLIFIRIRIRLYKRIKEDRNRKRKEFRNF